MKRIATAIAAGTLLAAFAWAQPGKPGYTVIDLGAVGNPPGGPNFIAANGLVAGAAATADGSAMRAVLYYKGHTLDLGAGHPNSAALGVNDLGQVVGEADTMNPAGADDFCGFNADGFPSSSACLPFLWHNGIIKLLPTLGGANGIANMINNRGQAVGWAETATSGPGCPVSRFEPVLWQSDGIRQLSIAVPGSSDTYGLAAQINDNGQIVGASGTCGPFDSLSEVYLVENHALLWDREGTPHDLGNLGGEGGLAGNHACALNNHGQVVGHSELTSDPSGPFHAFLWTEAAGMVDLKTLPGDFASLALGINEQSLVVGASISADFNALTAVLWQNGAITDLNQLITVNPAKLQLLAAFSINFAGEIVGFAFSPADNSVHGFMATPNSGQNPSLTPQNVGKPTLTESARKLVLRRLAIRFE